MFYLFVYWLVGFFEHRPLGLYSKCSYPLSHLPSSTQRLFMCHPLCARQESHPCLRCQRVSVQTQGPAVLLWSGEPNAVRPLSNVRACGNQHARPQNVPCSWKSSGPFIVPSTNGKMAHSPPLAQGGPQLCLLALA